MPSRLIWFYQKSRASDMGIIIEKKFSRNCEWIKQWPWEWWKPNLYFIIAISNKLSFKYTTPWQPKTEKNKVWALNHKTLQKIIVFQISSD